MKITKTLYFTTVVYSHDNSTETITFDGKLNVVKATKQLHKTLGTLDFYISKLDTYKEVYSCDVKDFLSVAEKI